MNQPTPAPLPRGKCVNCADNGVPLLGGAGGGFKVSIHVQRWTFSLLMNLRMSVESFASLSPREGTSGERGRRRILSVLGSWPRFASNLWKFLLLMKRSRSLLYLLLVTSVACTETDHSQPSHGGESPINAKRSTVLGNLSDQRALFEAWIKACSRLPTNREQQFRIPPKQLLPLKSFADLEIVIDEFFGWSTNGVMNHPDLWLGEKPAAHEFFNVGKLYSEPGGIPFQPFAQKLTVPPGSKVVFHGDFHGDVHSLNKMLSWLNEKKYMDGFKLAQANVYLVFLGDYTDRGIYGSEVIYTLLKLKHENPNNVWMTRGNHEDISLTSRYGFLQEFVSKFGNDPNAIRKVSRIYDFLPVVLYLGTEDNFIQCNHGGMEPGFDPSALLATKSASHFQFLGTLNQAQFIQQNSELLQSLDPLKRNQYKRLLKDFVPQSPTFPTILGFMWNDFSILKDEPPLGLDPGRGWVYGKTTTQVIFEKATSNGVRIRSVFRAHQHSGVLNPMMRRLRASSGVFRHWQDTDSPSLLNANDRQLQENLENRDIRTIPDGSVWTFNVAPDSVYGKNCDYTFDAYGILTVNERFENWSLEVINQTVVN